MPAINERIRDILEERSLIQRDVAEKAGFTPMQFSDMLSGRKLIKAEYIPAIAMALGVPIRELFENTKPAGEISIAVHLEGMDEAMKRVRQLVGELEKANSLADELALKSDKVVRT